MAGKPQPAGPRRAPTAAAAADGRKDYWDGEEAGQFAGLVYPAREDDAGLEDAARRLR